MFRMSLGAILIGGLSLANATSVAAGVETAVNSSAINPAINAGILVPHRAIYDLKLKDATERSGVEGMSGRMVYEFTGSACTGFSTNFRLVTKISTGEETRVSDQQTTTYEDLSANQFHFETKSFTDEQMDKQLSGEAVSAESGVKVEITEPDAREIDLPASDFPTGHMLDVIDNAKKGKNFFEARIFDGSENGDQSLLATTVIGKPQQPAADDNDSAKAGEFAKTSYWPVTIAYFNDGGSGDTVPVYRMSFKLYDNGITRDLNMDYGDFTLTGSLSKLEMLEKPKCP